MYNGPLTPEELLMSVPKTLSMVTAGDFGQHRLEDNISVQ